MSASRPSRNASEARGPLDRLRRRSLLVVVARRHQVSAGRLGPAPAVAMDPRISVSAMTFFIW